MLMKTLLQTLLVILLALYSTPPSDGSDLVSRFGIHSQLQWIVDDDRDGNPDERVNFGDITDIPRPADYDGDGESDFAVLRDVGGQWEWIFDFDRDGVPDFRTTYGNRTDYARPADYNGDGAADLAVTRGVSGQWEWIVDTGFDGLINLRVIYGNTSDRPRPADYDGDGAADFAVLRDVDGQWEWIVDFNRDGTPDHRVLYGEATDYAKPGDYDGDGATDFAVLRDVGGQWEWIVDFNRDGTPDHRVLYGDTTDFAKPGDYDGDGATDFAVLRNVGGQWEWIVDVHRDGVPDIRQIYGDTSDYARPADYDGDGGEAFAVVRKQHYINGPAWSELGSAVDSLVMDHLEDQGIPGATVAISKDGRLVLAKGYGFRHAESKTAMLPYHRTRIGSVSKVITALGAMKLTEQGVDYEIDKPLYGAGGVLDHPDYIDAIVANVAGQEDPHPLEWFTGLTSAHLLSHSAGFDRAEDVADTAEGLGVDLADLTYKQVHVNFLGTKAIQHEPGTASSYNNHHLGVLGHIIESVSGDAYGDYVATNILAPVGLDHVQLEDGVVDWQESFAHTYITSVVYGERTDFVRPADYDGDGKADFAVLREVGDQWEWIVDTDRDGRPNFREIYGNRTDIARPADYDGDGVTDFAVLRDVSGQWEWIIDTNRNGVPDLRIIYGVTSDRPRPADYDGDGATDLAVLRDVRGQWEWILDTDRDGVPEPALRTVFGNAVDVAYPADYDGDGAADFAVLKDIGNKWEWNVDTDRDGTPEPGLIRLYGDTSDSPIPADYDGDGATDFAVLRGVGTSRRWIIDTDHNGVSNIRVDYGLTTDFPFPADYDGDGATDFALVREAGNQWRWYFDSDRDGTSDSRDVAVFGPEPNPLGYAAGGWTAAARDLVRLMCATDAPLDYGAFLNGATLEVMEDPGAAGLALDFPIQTFADRVLGWDRQSNGALSHDGALGGGHGYMIKYGDGTDPVDGVDVRGINVSVLFNINNGTGRGTLVNEIAKAAAQVEIAADYDLFGESDLLGGRFPGPVEKIPRGDNPYGVAPLVAYAFDIGPERAPGRRSPLPRVSLTEDGMAEIRFRTRESIQESVRLVIEKSQGFRSWEEFAVLPAGGGRWEADDVRVILEDGQFEVVLCDRRPGPNAYYRARVEVSQ